MVYIKMYSVINRKNLLNDENTMYTYTYYISSKKKIL